MKKLLIIFASQEYKSANHKNLWHRLSERYDGDVLIVNIPADRIVSVLKRKTDRISDAKRGLVKLSDHLFLIRPLFFIRPELSVKFFGKTVAKIFWKIIKKYYPDLDERHIDLLIYNAHWVKILSGSRKNLNIAYYLYDEVRLSADSGKIDKNRMLLDNYACKNSDVVFAMTKVLADSRRELNKNIYVLGNGAEISPVCAENKLERSAAFIGNFRNWIDKELFESIIRECSNITFVFVGPVEGDMRGYFDHLLNEYDNTLYYGIVKKERMNSIYGKFSCVIIPYLQNDFIKATRPIKIVESVLAGTPVVTVPVDGYQENTFIRFAQTKEIFCEQINYFMDHPINRFDDEYKEFVCANTWTSIADRIVELIKKNGSRE